MLKIGTTNGYGRRLRSRLASTMKDLSIQISLNNLTLSMHRTNMVFILNGDHSKIKKNRYPPPILTHANQARRLPSIFMARPSRWLQARLSPDQIRLEVAMECIELILLGYCTSIIRKAWHLSELHDPFQSSGLQVINFISTSRMRCQANGCFDVEICRTLVDIFGDQKLNQNH